MFNQTRYYRYYEHAKVSGKNLLLYSSGSRCNKLIFALPRKSKVEQLGLARSKCLNFKTTRRLLYLPTIPENMKYLNYIFEMFRNSGNLVRGILHCQGFF